MPRPPSEACLRRVQEAGRRPRGQSHTLPKCSAIDCEQVSQVKCVHCLQNFCTAHRQPHYCVWEHCKFPGCRSSSSITLSTPCRYCDDFYCDSHVKFHEVTCPKRPPISPPCSQGSLLDDGTDSDSEEQLEGRGGPMPETPRGGTAAALSPVGRTASSPVASRARAVAVAWPTKAATHINTCTYTRTVRT